MARQQIEVDIPDGYEFVGYRQLCRGEQYITPAGNPCIWNREYKSANCFIIVRPIEKWRIPTKLDLLNRDSIPCRVRNSSDRNWQTNVLVAIISDDFTQKFVCDFTQKFVCEDDDWFACCEIRDTEPRPAEFWTVKSTTGEFFGMYRSKDEAKDACIDEWSVVHLVEVPE